MVRSFLERSVMGCSEIPWIENRVGKRIRINKSNSQSVFECYGRLQHKYNAVASKWDPFEAFAS